MSFFYSPFDSPFYDFFDDISNAVDQVQQSLPYRQNRKAIQSKDSKNTGAVSKVTKPTAPAKKNDSLISSFLRDPFFDHDLDSTLTPALNITENTKAYTLKVSVPGAAKDHLSIDFNKDNNELIIKGEVPATENDEKSGDTVVHVEIPAGKFERRLRLPATVDGEKIKAAFNNGILTLQVPKVADGKNLKRIEISESSEFGSE